MDARLHHMQVNFELFGLFCNFWKFISNPDFIQDFNEHDEKARTRWHKIKLDRILIDYLLREGLYDTAIMFAKDSKIEVGSHASLRETSSNLII